MNEKSTQSLILFVRGFVLGVIGISSFYFLLLFLVTKDIYHPINQLSQYQPWMGLLVVGFGVQMGLFWLMRNGVRFNISERSDANLAAGTSSSVSGLAMVACCAHHATDILPILGLSATAIFLSQYQLQFLIIGVISNVFAIAWMMWLISGRPRTNDLTQYMILIYRRLR